MTAAPPLVSVCIANYNGEHILRDCIDSVLAQDTGADVEIIVHDDASTDGSLAILDAEYPMVHVIRANYNVGFCVANNRMAAQATGDYLLLLNNDAALAPDSVRSLLQAATTIGKQAILTLPQVDWISGRLVDLGCLLDPFVNPVPNLDPGRTDVAYVIGACLWIPRSLWNQLDGLPEWMGSLAEDLYLCGLARLRGVPVRAVSTSYYRHRQGTSFGGNRADEAGLRLSLPRRCLTETNKTRAMFILTPGPLVWPLLAAHLLLLTAEGLAVSFIHGDSAILKKIYLAAIRTVLSELKTLRGRRAKIQASRTISVREWFRPYRWQLRKLSLLIRYGIPKQI